MTLKSGACPACGSFSGVELLNTAPLFHNTLQRESSCWLPLSSVSLLRLLCSWQRNLVFNQQPHYAISPPLLNAASSSYQRVIQSRHSFWTLRASKLLYKRRRLESLVIHFPLRQLPGMWFSPLHLLVLAYIVIVSSGTNLVGCDNKPHRMFFALVITYHSSPLSISRNRSRLWPQTRCLILSQTV